MIKLPEIIPNLEFHKSPEILALVSKTLSNEFKVFGLTPVDLSKPEYLVTHLLFNGAIVYCSINTLKTLNDGTKHLNFSYSYLHPFFRKLGFGSKFFAKRVAIYERLFPDLMFTTTIRINNQASLKIVKKHGFIAVSDYLYKNGDKGVKLIKLNNS